MKEWIYFIHPPRDDFAATMTDEEKSVWGRHFERLQRMLKTVAPSSAGMAELINAFPNFAELAKSAGIHGIRVEDPADVKPALIEAFQHDGPALIDVVVNRMELSMPPTIKLEQAIGFNLWAIKAVLSGRGNELVDLAVSNLIR